MADQSSKATILSGKELAARLRGQVAEKVADRGRAGLTRPGLATILVGEEPSSQVYVRNKQKSGQEVGIHSIGHVLPEDTRQDALLELIHELNINPEVHGILVQLPLPKHLDEAAILAAISPSKDVDGLHPYNAGLLAQKGRQPLFTPVTPSGILLLLQEARVSLQGAEVVVLGRSNIVGLPLALMLVKANATVTIAHSKSQHLPALSRRADILIAAVGQPELVSVDWVKPGATVIDVGVNRLEDKVAKKGYRLVGDVAFDEVRHVAGALTPVPGGVGPLTIAVLLQNTLHAAQLSDAAVSLD